MIESQRQHGSRQDPCGTSTGGDSLSDTVSEELKARLEAFVGQPMGGLSTAPDPVNVPMIRHWVDALDDENPIYLDDSVASAGRFGGIVAPPAMLQTWTMGRPKIQGLAERGGAPTTFDTNPISVLDEAGYVATRATDSELEFERYLAPGDELKSSSVVESISDEKKTALGRGFFVTWVTTYTDAKDQIVGRQLFRVLKFKPAGSSPPGEDA
jgi:acyl dehydratase